MKTKLLLLSVFILGGYFFECLPQDKHSTVNAKTLTVHYTPDMQALVQHWTDAYVTDQNTRLNTLVLKDKNLELKPEELCVISDAGLKSHQLNEAWRMVVGRSVVVPVISKNNDHKQQLLQSGLTPEAFNALIFQTSGQNTQNDGTPDLQAYIEDDATVKATLTSNNPGLRKDVFLGTEALLKTHKKEKNAILFCQLSHITNAKGGLINDDIMLLPIDKNANGKIDAVENIYANAGSLKRGVWLGKYPANLYQNFYLVAATKPGTGDDAAFANWLITKGQAPLEAMGYQALVHSEVPSKLASIQAPEQVPDLAETTPLLKRNIIIIALLVLVLVILIDTRVRYLKKRNSSSPKKQNEAMHAFKAGEINLPGGLKYDTSHSWVFMEKNGDVRIGIDAFLMHATGEHFRMVLKNEGGRIEKGEHLLTLIQDGKQLNIKAPLSGTINKLNNDIIYDPAKAYHNPYEQGWVYVVTPENWENEAHVLLNSEKYKTWINHEIKRFKAFIANMLQNNDSDMQAVVLQDGGELIDNTLMHLSPEIWEEFQNQFLD